MRAAIVSGVCVVAMGIALWSTAEEAAEPQPCAAEAPEPRPSAPLVLVKIHADWCVVCARMDTTWTKLERRLAGRAELLVLDVTDRDALLAARALAEEHDLVAFFEAFRSRTGTAALLRRGVREPLRVFEGELDPAVYAAAVAAAVATRVAEAPPRPPDVSPPPPGNPRGPAEGR